MYKFLFIVFIQLNTFHLNASNDSSTNILVTNNKIILGIESNLKFISSDLNFQKQGFDLGLNLNYYLNNIIFIGAYYNQMNDVWNTSDKTFMLNQRNVNISTANFNDFGVLAGYRMIENKRFTIIPELRLGYGSLAFKAINSEKIENVEMITIDPKLNFGYKLNKSSIIGLSTSYLVPIYLDRLLLNEYDLQHVSLGVFFKTAFLKTKKKSIENNLALISPELNKNGLNNISIKPDSTVQDTNKSNISVEIINTENSQKNENSSEIENFNSASNQKNENSSDIDNNNSASYSSNSNSYNTSIENNQVSKNSSTINKYIIVVASFMNQKNALKFINEKKQTSNKKFSMLYDSDVNRYRIVFMVNETRANVIEIRQNTRSEFPGAWIMDFEN